MSPSSPPRGPLRDQPARPEGDRARRPLRPWRAAFRDAGRGVAWAARHERHMRVHLAAAAAVVAAGLGIGIPPAAWAALVFAIALVVVAELVNTAVETLSDLAHPAPDPAIGRLKDLAAGTVLVAATAAAVVGLLVLVPALLHRLGH
ncbi:MAG TPA: diacylglycerol kinase family protein [Candidatus Micrarchaeia archaeon]|nr:diacylglycerol kinase family protein [Candidatus Micrarchaeia archaeon]